MQQVSVGFLSFVGPNYSRSSTLLNFKSLGIEKTYLHVPGKFLKSIRWIFKNRYDFRKMDVIVVMSPCHILTPALKLITNKPIVLDAGWSLTDGVLSRGFKVQNLYKLPMIFAVDLISMHSADLVLVESSLQRNRTRKIFLLSRKKVQISYTGLDEFQFKNSIESYAKESELLTELRESIEEKAKSLVVLFRGKVNRESGFETICEAAKILSNEATFIFILGERDLVPTDLENVIRLSNVSSLEMMEIYGMAQVAIGQISCHPRLNYTIPHKAFEAGYFKKAYVTSQSNGIREIYDDESVSYLSKSNSETLAKAIRTLASEKSRLMLEVEIGLQYEHSLSQEVINKQFAQIIRDIASQLS